jgi:FkbM family methyltransferase
VRLRSEAGPIGRIRHAAARGLARRGFVVVRHPVIRLQAMLTAHQVDVVLDVGAARGDYARELREFGYDGRIVSFEPLSDAFAELARLSNDDPRWTAMNLALGSEQGEAVINVASNSDSSSLLPMETTHTDSAPHVTYVRQETINVEPLDVVAVDLLSADARPFLKIDTQGFEREVLDGAKNTLDQCVGLQLEVSFVPLYEGGMLVDESIAYAYDRGFRLVGMERGFTSPSGQVLQADAVFFRLP